MIKTASRVQLKKIRDLLRHREAREEHGEFICEGRKITGDIVGKNHTVKYLLVSRKFADADHNKVFLVKAKEKGIELFETKDKYFETVSALDAPQGILAVIAKPIPLSLPDIAEREHLAVLCDGIQDPGNLGNIIRTSVSFSAGFMLLTGASTDIFNPKTVRASSGTIMDIPIYKTDVDQLEQLKKLGYALIASRSDQTDCKSVLEINTAARHAIIAFGSEGKGISEEIEAISDECFAIPTSENVESLNVMNAVAVTLFEYNRIKRAGKSN